MPHPNYGLGTMARFWIQVDSADVYSAVNCWEWTGAIIKEHGVIRINNKNVYAHRLAYEWFRGEIPEGLVTDHLCLNPRCVNPFHLELVTLAENTRRAQTQARCIRGHEYIILSSGAKTCRTCNALNARRRRQHAKRS